MTQREFADKVFVACQTFSKWKLRKSESDNVSLSILITEMNFDKKFQKEIKDVLISRKNMLLTKFAIKSLHNH